MLNPKVSIIIPAYNSASTIGRTVDSVLAQTFSDFELILIDDGSHDKTYSILQGYQDQRLRVYTQTNRGPALTRNRGIELARGEYLMFIDSDDYIGRQYVGKYYQEITSRRADLVIGGYKHLKNNKVDFVRRLKPGRFAKYIVMAPYCKIYRRDFIKRHHITFLDTMSSEDVYFSALLYSKNPKISLIDDTSYYYCYRTDSISNTTHKGFDKKVDILDLMKRINFQDIEDVELNQYFITRYIIWYLLYSGKTASPKKFYQEYQKYFAWLEKNIPNYNKNPNIRIFGPDGELPRLGFIVYVFMMLRRLSLIKVLAKAYCKGE